MMTFYDAVMVLLVLLTIVQGAWRGMIWQIAPIVSLVLGYIVAYPMSLTVAHYFGDPPLNRLWAMIAIYATVSLGVYLVLRSVRESFDRLKLTEFDRHLGALLGCVKGLLIAIVITIGLITVSPQAREIILKSESSTIAARTVNTISPILPDALNNLIRPYISNLKNQLPPDERDQTWPIASPTARRNPRVIARQDGLAKPRRFDSDDGYVPEPIDDAPVAAPRRTPNVGTKLRTTGPSRSPQPVPDEMNVFPEFAPPSPRRSNPSSSDILTPTTDDFANPEPAPRKPTRPTRQPAPKAPTAPIADDFFNADPDQALSKPQR